MFFNKQTNKGTARVHVLLKKWKWAYSMADAAHDLCRIRLCKNSWKWPKTASKIFGIGGNIFGMRMEFFPFSKNVKSLYEKRHFRHFCLLQISWSNIFLFLLLFSFLLFFLLWNGDRIFMSYERLDCFWGQHIITI